MTVIPNTPHLLDGNELEVVTQFVTAITGAKAIKSSFVETEDTVYGLIRPNGSKKLAILTNNTSVTDGFQGERNSMPSSSNYTHYMLCSLTPENAAAIRKAIPALQPQPIGLGKSIGMGDRLGIATPGHVRAVSNGEMKPIFAQQSMRENERTGRTPQEVIDDATWGVLQGGFLAGYGADADHLKSTEHIDISVAAGFTFFTVDPGDYVDDSADQADLSELQTRLDALPWQQLETNIDDTMSRYTNKTVALSTTNGDITIKMTPEVVVKAVTKYGGAVGHVTRLYRHLLSQMPEDAFEFEVSVDETETPTSVAEHYYIASELNRLGVKWVSLAPRFVGRFEKGVDYIGDLEAFRTTFAGHVAVAEHFGGYKLSLHSGSDKFSIYPIAAQLAGNALHVKTAGTSYLEALRTVAHVAPDFYRELLAFCIEKYNEDKRTYHVSADVAKVEAPGTLSDDLLPATLDTFDTRQVCHVTFGSVLQDQNSDGSSRFHNKLMDVLNSNEDLYHELLAQHFGKHVRLCQ